MQGKLKQSYQTHKEVSRSSYFQGQIEAEALPRLGELLASKSAAIDVKFEFQNSDYDTALVSGEVQTMLEMECQRCLQAISVPLHLEFKLLIDAPDDIVQESSLDTIYSEDGLIDIFEVVEDELILALPLVAMHESNLCNEHWQVSEHDQEPVVRENPFSVLKDLKTTH